MHGAPPWAVALWNKMGEVGGKVQEATNAANETKNEEKEAKEVAICQDCHARHFNAAGGSEGRLKQSKEEGVKMAESAGAKVANTWTRRQEKGCKTRNAISRTDARSRPGKSGRQGG